ncbi:MAG: T9SS type A sorting domain-containing protein [Bacteroidota bacterium]
MKKLPLSLLLFFVSSMVMAQVWAPSGATWYYEWRAMWYSGYVKITYTGDTIIDAKTTKIFKKELFTYDWENHLYSNGIIGRDYTFMENDIVYYYRNGQFFKLYDFNAEPGDSWKVAGWESSHPCSDTAWVVTMGAGFATINSVVLKYLKVAPGHNAAWAFSADTIIGRIGSLGYMFPEPVCVVDLYEGGALRCYYDDDFGLFKRGSDPSCDFITGWEDDRKSGDHLKIYPVPAISDITLEFPGPVDDEKMIEIFDLLGNRITVISTSQEKLTIDIEDLATGIYFLSVTDKRGFNLKGKIIKNEL